MSIQTAQNETDIRCRLRFLVGQYRQDTQRTIEALQQRAAALREVGAPKAKCEAAEADVAQASSCGSHNAKVLEALFKSATFEPPTDGGCSQGGALYDSGGQVLRCLARDWTVGCATARQQTLEPVLQRLCQKLGGAPSHAEVPRLWVPGCGMGRLALEAAARFQCFVTANDESTAIIAGFAGLLHLQRVTFFPAFDAAAPAHSPGRKDQFKEVVAAIVAEGHEENLGISLLQAAEGLLRIEQLDFTRQAAPEASFEAVATLFVLDTVASLPDAVQAIAQALRPGGMWVNCGPLRKHREQRNFTFEDIASFAEACGLIVEENDCLENCEYISREVSLSIREIYDVQILVARKPNREEEGKRDCDALG